MRKPQQWSGKAGDRLQKGTAERGRRTCGRYLRGNIMHACVLLGVEPC